MTCRSWRRRSRRCSVPEKVARGGARGGWARKGRRSFACSMRRDRPSERSSTFSARAVGVGAGSVWARSLWARDRCGRGVGDLCAGLGLRRANVGAGRPGQRTRQAPGSGGAGEGWAFASVKGRAPASSRARSGPVRRPVGIGALAVARCSAPTSSRGESSSVVRVGLGVGAGVGVGVGGGGGVEDRPGECGRRRLGRRRRPRCRSGGP